MILEVCHVIMSSHFRTTNSLFAGRNNLSVLVYQPWALRPNAGEDTYPPRDGIPADILADGAEATEVEYAAHAFFGSIIKFLAFEDWLSDCRDRRRAIQLWEQSNMRIGGHSMSSCFERVSPQSHSCPHEEHILSFV
jgi:hypothetical protein